MLGSKGERGDKFLVSQTRPGKNLNDLGKGLLHADLPVLSISFDLEQITIERGDCFVHDLLVWNASIAVIAD